MQVEPSVRVDNIWESQTSYITFSVSSPDEAVEITYTPNGGDGLVFLNGFEIDTPAIGNQVSFPTPANRDERLEPEDDSVTASWRAPTGVESPTYNVYLGTAEDDLAETGKGLSEPSVALSGKYTV